MKNQTFHQNTLAGVLVLITGGLITSALLLLQYFKVIDWDYELIAAPFLVTSFLAFGDNLMVYLIISAMFFISHLMKRSQATSIQNKHLTHK